MGHNIGTMGARGAQLAVPALAVPLAMGEAAYRRGLSSPEGQMAQPVAPSPIPQTEGLGLAFNQNYNVGPDTSMYSSPSTSPFYALGRGINNLPGLIRRGYDSLAASVGSQLDPSNAPIAMNYQPGAVNTA